MESVEALEESLIVAHRLESEVYEDRLQQIQVDEEREANRSLRRVAQDECSMRELAAVNEEHHSETRRLSRELGSENLAYILASESSDRRFAQLQEAREEFQSSSAGLREELLAMSHEYEESEACTEDLEMQQVALQTRVAVLMENEESTN